MMDPEDGSGCENDSVTREEIIRAARALPADERLAAAREIFLSVAEEDPDLAKAAWDSDWDDGARAWLLGVERSRVGEFAAEDVAERIRAVLRG